MGKKSQKRKKQKLHQKSALPNKSNEKKNIWEFLFMIFIYLFILVALLSFLFQPLPGYNSAKGWDFYEWLLRK